MTKKATSGGLKRIRQVAGLIAGVAGFLWLLMFPPEGLNIQASRLAAVVLLVVVFWVTEAMPSPMAAALGTVISAFLNVAPWGHIFSAFIDPVILLFVGSFLLARALEAHQVDQRLARAVLTHPWVGGSAYRVLAALGLTAWCLAMWLSITAAVALLLPVALALARSLSRHQPQSAKAEVNFGEGLLLWLVYAASAGAMATPIGTPPNLIGLAFIRDILGREINFIEWMAVGLPVALVLLIVRYGIVLWLFAPRDFRLDQKWPMAAPALPPWTGQARMSVLAFGVALCLWVGPGAAGLVFGHDHLFFAAARKVLAPGYAAMAAALLLFLPVAGAPRQPALPWREALRIDWGTILLFGCGLSLGRLMFSTGLSGVAGRAILALVSDNHAAVLAAVTIMTVTALSEIASNTAAAAMALPVVLSFLPARSAFALPIAMAATFAASLGFLLPVSTPGNAMVRAAGSVSSGAMIRAGLLVDAAGMLVVWAASLWLVPMVMNAAWRN